MADSERWRAFRVTAENLATLIGALPKSIINTVKRAAMKDWRKSRAIEIESAEKRAEIEGGLPMGYTLIYESKDGKLCLYQDRDGHLIAADARKFV